ncbi:mechanosensitive ion channel family protein [Nocardia arthritidis]|uniref:mechanosensitive ion channel family protein n=1 Tax=Nocardia arthritidis TaxID=228602 RepID=UPI001931AC73|nr:mechanosensitive ion channel family protein [Nocardia arthritidis]
MNKPLLLAIAAALVIAGPLAGIALRRFVIRLEHRTTEGPRSLRSLGLRLAHDLAIPVAALVGLMFALSLPGALPIAPTAAHNALLVALIIVISYAVSRIAADIIASVVLAVTGAEGSVSLFATMTRVLVFGIGILITLGSLGIQITPLLGALGIGGLAVALALQATLANLFAGIHILASKMVQHGDFVRLDSGESGWIHDIGWRNTTLKEIPGNYVIVPNAKFADAILTNYHQPEQSMAVVVECGVSYRSDLEQVERVALEVGREVMCELDVGVAHAEPRVRFHTFGESSIDFRVVLWTRHFADQYLLVSEFIKRLHERFQQEKIVIPYPIRTLELGFTNGHTMTPFDALAAELPIDPEPHPAVSP